MTEAEFLAAFAALADTLLWTRVTARGLLRAFEGRAPFEWCPVTAVAYAWTGQRWDVTEWDAAARALGLPLALASHVVHAADNDTPTRPVRVLRRQLLQRCRLTARRDTAEA
jgi:hypothetical protein